MLRGIIDRLIRTKQIEVDADNILVQSDQDEITLNQSLTLIKHQIKGSGVLDKIVQILNIIDYQFDDLNAELNILKNEFISPNLESSIRIIRWDGRVIAHKGTVVSRYQETIIINTMTGEYGIEIVISAKPQIDAKYRILWIGLDYAGKTTLLNAISFFIPPEARVVTIEDTRELNLLRDNWLPSVSRSATGIKGLGAVDLFDLLRSSFRQNPDYVIVGETRGKEASVMFQGMASGHSSISTLHADSVDTVIKRLETRPIELSPTLMNVLDSVCIMTHAVIKKQETRKLKEIVEIINVNSEGVAVTNTPFKWDPATDQFYFKKTSKVFEKIKKRYGLEEEALEIEFKKRVQLIYKLYQLRIFEFEKVRDIINEYYKKPKAVLKRFGIE